MKIEQLTKEAITVTAETTEEALDLLFLRRIGPLDPRYVPVLTLQQPTLECPAYRRAVEEGGGWARVTVSTNYLTPYWEELKKRTGCDPFDLDLTEAFKQIRPINIIERLWYETATNLTYATVFEIGCSGTGKVLEGDEYVARAERYALRYLERDLGETTYEPEFIETANGLYKRNPKYARGDSYCKPRAVNEKVWRVIWKEWAERFASDEQKASLSRRSTTVGAGSTNYPVLMDWDGFYVDNFSGRVKWSEFSQMGGSAVEQA